MTNTLDWGFSRVESALNDVNVSIEDLQADFDYGIGLLVTQMQIQNEHLSNLIDKLDAVHKTLQSPTLTKAREFFNIGCERLKKGLLDKALEAFLEAEKYNDTDFFTQYNIGMLFLQGKDEDDNVINLHKAKNHLTLAVRYAKAEISVDSSFSNLAAQALFHSSLATYFQLGEFDYSKEKKKANLLLEESKGLAEQAIAYNPKFSEGFYHIATYSALLGDRHNAMRNLELAINLDRNYAIKIDTDHAFNEIRDDVYACLTDIAERKKQACQNKLSQATTLLEELSKYLPEQSFSIRTSFQSIKNTYSQAVAYYESGTYFDFLDSLQLLEKIIKELPSLKEQRIDECIKQKEADFTEVRNILPKGNDYSEEVLKIIKTVNKQLVEVQTKYRGKSPDSFFQSIAILSSAKTLAKEARDKVDAEKRILMDKARKQNEELIEKEEQKAKQEEEARKKKWKKEKRFTAVVEYAVKGLFWGGGAGFLLGFATCMVDCANHSTESSADPLNGIVFGAIIGFVGGIIVGLMNEA
ncbi:MAG: hypothetical protein EPO24_04190 [Bacteroidetes bacterium]|nr:MAG: hypothetical protein EPO24_04190 [Bacteroidota bacterium]